MIEIWFPTAVKIETINDIDNRNLESVCYEIKEKHNSFLDPNCDLYTTFGTDVNLYNLEIFKLLLDNIFQHVILFAKDYGFANPFIKLVNLWINISKINESHGYHIHQNSHFSAVYYIKTPKNSGNITFEHPYKNMFPILPDKYTPLSYPEMTIEPKENMLLIFPSYISHMVGKNKSDEDRISVAMNFTVHKS